MSKENKELYEFGAFRLDVDEHTFELIDGSKNGSLREKAFHKLAVLVRNRGRSTYQDLSLNRIGERMIAPKSKKTFKYMSGRRDEANFSARDLSLGTNATIRLFDL